MSLFKMLQTIIKKEQVVLYIDNAPTHLLAETLNRIDDSLVIEKHKLIYYGVLWLIMMHKA